MPPDPERRLLRRIKTMSVNQDTLRARMASGARRLFTPSFGVVWEQLRSGRGSVRKTGIGFGALAAAVWLFLPNAALAAPNAFSFGVFPQLSTRLMAETYQPLVDSLGDSIRQPVSLESAKDFFTFHQRTAGGEYDLVLTAPHLAWLAWKEGGYRPILIYEEPAKGFVVVRADSPYRQLSDLRGKSLAIPDPNAVVNIRLAKTLAKAGLHPGQELAVIEAGSHTNAVTHVSDKQTDAAIVGVFPFLRLPNEVREGLRIIAETPDLPSHVFLVHPSTSTADEHAIRRAIEQFVRGQSGKVFLEKTGFGGVRALKKDELKQVEGDALEFRKRSRVQAASAGKPK
jgi:phosphonate transport system substrate-binding protein